MPLVPIFPYCTKEIKNGQASTQPAMKNQGTACYSFLLNIHSSHPVLKVGITAEQVPHVTWPEVRWPASIKCHQNVHAVMCFVCCCSEKPSELNFQLMPGSRTCTIPKIPKRVQILMQNIFNISQSGSLP